MKADEDRPDRDWVRHEQITVNGRLVTKGSEITVKGLGRCRFQEHVEKEDAEWISVVDKRGKYRSIDVTRKITVHRKNKLRGS